MRNSKPVYAVPGRFKFEIPVTADLLNAGNSIHGGASAAILDTLMSTSSWDIDSPTHVQPGVTIDMSIIYAGPALEGDIIIIDVQTLKKGKTMAFYRGDIYLKDSGKLVASAQQTLALMDGGHKAKL